LKNLALFALRLQVSAGEDLLAAMLATKEDGENDALDRDFVTMPRYISVRTNLRPVLQESTGTACVYVCVYMCVLCVFCVCVCARVCACVRLWFS
jgi:hypothetical protein